MDPLATPANLIIAHNAGFDRCFLERRFPLFVAKPWACSMRQVPWAEEGLGSTKLDYLLNRCGFFFDDHRAMADCRAVLHLLSLQAPAQRPADPAAAAGDRPAAEPFASGRWRRRPSARTCSSGTATAGTAARDGRPRAWYRDLDKDLLAEKEQFLAEKMYNGGHCRHELIRIDYSNRFSDRV